jgi:hypothetical protein
MSIAKLTLALGTVGLAVAFAGSHTIHLMNKSDIGGVTLKPGAYNIQVDGNRAVIKHDRQVVNAPVKVETAPQKYESTAVVLDTSQKPERVDEIDLGGTHTRLVVQRAGATQSNGD